ncbi:FAD-dependent oxidoreductase [Lyngbya aestuarii]|uniref:FAD-dependent oxidoreductase n=1 Tax=Lyngbya aestuarii TaxID=118322 RepID=UPI00403D6F8C
MSNPTYQTLILGGGFTGLFTALHLAHTHYPRTVILIDQEDRFCFKPLLYEYCSGEMETQQVVPRFEELLDGSGVIFVQDTVQSIDLRQREVQLTSGTSYNYSNLVLALGSVTGYFGVEGAQENSLPLRSREDAIAIDKQLRDCLRQARQTADLEQRRRLLTTAVIGAGPSGVEMAGTLADLLPRWYEALGGNPQEVRVVLLNHGQEILQGDINNALREVAEQELRKRVVPVEFLMEAEATAIRHDAVEYQRHNQQQTLPASTVIWTTGTNTHPLIKALAVPDEDRDRHGRLQVSPTLQLPNFPEVFAGGDCAAQQGANLPPTAQVAYQQGAAIADNLKAMALGYELQPAVVNLRGTLLKLGLDNSAANIFNSFEVTGEVGHLIRQGTYLELLPTPIHNLKITTEWLKDEIFRKHLDTADGSKTAVRAMEVVGGVVVGAIVAKKLINALSDQGKSAS